MPWPFCICGYCTGCVPLEFEVTPSGLIPGDAFACNCGLLNGTTYILARPVDSAIAPCGFTAGQCASGCKWALVFDAPSGCTLGTTLAAAWVLEITATQFIVSLVFNLENCAIAEIMKWTANYTSPLDCKAILATLSFVSENSDWACNINSAGTPTILLSSH